MIKNLKSKLKQIENAVKQELHNPKPIDNDLDGGIVVENKWGRCQLFETVCDLDFDIDDAAGIWQDAGVSLRHEDFLFIDTETTGLSRSLGTLAFLIGIGVIENGRMIVRQYLSRDMDEEKSALYEVIKQMEAKKLLISYNGKCFDWPLLENRFILNRIQPPDWEDAHLDLLHHCRRLWKRSLPGCSLKNIEKYILGIIRIDDPEGYEIPGIYEQWRDGGDNSDMHRVIEHNRLDIVSLASVYKAVGQLYKQPQNMTGQELYGAAYYMEMRKETETAVRLYYMASARPDSPITSVDTRYSLLLKRFGRYNEAEMIWQRMIQRPGNLNLFPYEELAKYNEHKIKDLIKAETFAQAALNLLEKSADLEDTVVDEKSKAQLLHRIKRLNKKINRNTKTADNN